MPINKNLMHCLFLRVENLTFTWRRLVVKSQMDVLQQQNIAIGVEIYTKNTTGVLQSGIYK